MKKLICSLAGIGILIFLFGCGPTNKQVAREDKKLDSTIAKLQCDDAFGIESWEEHSTTAHIFNSIDVWKDTITFGTHSYAISRLSGLSEFKLNNKETDADGYYLKINLASYTAPMGSYTVKRMAIQKICISK